MKIQIISDLHLEFYSTKRALELINSIPVEADYLFIAGDLLCLREKEKSQEVFSLISSKWKTIYYVPGNHEFWGLIEPPLDYLSNFISQWKNIVYLNGTQVYKLEGREILGHTLWFPDDPLNFFYSKYMNDFWEIKDFTSWVYSENQKVIDFFDKNLNSNSIVLTHHLPSYYLVDEEYKNSNLNRFFVTELSEMIRVFEPKLWIYGHTHPTKTPKETVLYKTCFINNAYGYPNSIKTLYKTLEI